MSNAKFKKAWIQMLASDIDWVAFVLLLQFPGLSGSDQFSLASKEFIHSFDSSALHQPVPHSSFQCSPSASCVRLPQNYPEPRRTGPTTVLTQVLDLYFTPERRCNKPFPAPESNIKYLAIYCAPNHPRRLFVHSCEGTLC